MPSSPLPLSSPLFPSRGKSLPAPKLDLKKKTEVEFSLESIGSPLQKAGGAIFGDPTLRLVFLASMIRFCAGFTILAWLAPWARETLPNDVDAFIVYNAVIKSLGGLSATLIGAKICEELQKSEAAPAGFSIGGERADAVVPAVGSIVAAFLWVGLLLTDPVATDSGSFETVIFLLLLAYLAAENWLGPTVAIFQKGVPAESRGAALGLFGAATQVVGNAAPALVGQLDSAGMPLRDAFLSVVFVSYIASGLLFSAVAASIDPPADSTGLGE
mmetsp:Transcript_44648/g.100799  ORF Transcript_44648/g.100799 Transcript_44648/m.100799 type:complete len:272 (-) Transcript_44648:337-1152(-)